jgi:pimeloyl-ACP methyl ester carboxylesterase
MVERFDMHERLQSIHVPTLLLSGDRDVLVSERSLRELCAGLPEAKSVRLEGAGHLAFATQPIRTAEEVRAFLSTVNQAAGREE